MANESIALALVLLAFQEEKIGELLDVVAIGEAIVTEDVAVVPKLLNDRE